MEPPVGNQFQTSGGGGATIPSLAGFRYQRFCLSSNARTAFVERFSLLLAAAYTAPGMRSDPRNRPDLPSSEHTQKGDFGEALVTEPQSRSAS